MATVNGAAYAVFNIQLSEPAQSGLSVGWHTEDGTGKAGVDYAAASGNVTFAPGEVEQSIQVMVYGRTPGQSTEDRTFLIRLSPPVGAILANATAECVISVVTADDGDIFTQVYIPAGPRGGRGPRGYQGLNNYELAKINGFAGTLAQWLATVTGRNIELDNDGTHIRWRVVGDTAWNNLIAISALKGAPGNDGLPVELRRTSTAIQWRIGAAAFADLIQLADLKGDKGDRGQALVNRGIWASGSTYNPGEYVAATSSSSSVRSLYFLLDAQPYVSNAEPKNEPTHWVELQPPQGPAGREVQFQKTATEIQWRYSGDTAWTTLFLLADVKGNPGDDGREIELNKSSTHVQWRYEGETAWTNLIPLADITGTGKNIELQKGATYIQWRVVGDTAWQNLVAIADLVGAPGAAGSLWLTGTTVPAAALGKDGDNYLRTPVGEIYGKASGAWSLLMTISGGTSSGVEWFTSTSVPSNTTGKDGDLHLHETTGAVRKRVTTSGTTIWNVIATIPKFATSAEGKAATRTDVAATPVNVREFMEQYGFTSTYTNVVADLNAVTGTTDRTVIFNFSGSTKNTPVANSYGRGMMWASGGNYSTQLAIINGTGAMYLRFNEGGTWGSWISGLALLGYTTALPALVGGTGTAYGCIQNAPPTQPSTALTAFLAELANARVQRGGSQWISDNPGSVFHTYLSIRHRGGIDDGNSYGFVLSDEAMTAANYRSFTLRKQAAGTWYAPVYLFHTGNAAIDGNGFIKSASPIVRLTDDPELMQAGFLHGFTLSGYAAVNDEAEGVSAEKVATGVYKILGSLGFNPDGWTIEIPQDVNGNRLCFVETTTDADGTITVSVFKRRFDLDTAMIVAGAPMDIPEGRWIDLRLAMPENSIWNEHMRAVEAEAAAMRDAAEGAEKLVE